MRVVLVVQHHVFLSWTRHPRDADMVTDVLWEWRARLLEMLVPSKELMALKKSREPRVELLRCRNWSCDCVECRSLGARQPSAYLFLLLE
jgi:hypothetical protein